MIRFALVINLNNVFVFKGANPCDSLQCGPYQSCDIDHHGKATCQCDDACEQAVRLVCGSDGVTYHNECEMKKQGCLQKKMIKLLYKGECGKSNLSSLMLLVYLDFCQNFGEFVKHKFKA